MGAEERRKEGKKEREETRAEQGRAKQNARSSSHGYSRLLAAPLLAAPHATLTASLCVLSRNFNRLWM